MTDYPLMKTRAIAFLLLFLLSFGTAWAQNPGRFPRGTYVCTTADGRHLTSDRPIRECYNREQRVLGSSGLTLAVLNPNQSRQDQSQHNAQLEEQRQQERRIATLTRRLYATYPTQAGHDAAHQQLLAPLANKLQSAQTEMNEIQQKENALKQELSALNEAPPSTDLAQRLEFSQRDIIIQQRIVDELKGQIDVVNAQYTKERELLLPLWNTNTSAATP